ncbi:hypothetical protein BS50DRAFT_606772 [Corynespora cassiicola Philippines]|uniref:Rhodopsin domain-containing protein n=1 Tax=Corynespora cassiicola Philippines TaxID=1448308 RepID=A0A2T2P5J2_CORCC|nr:hypothetical protein BS50DRAFT_606772 [Corynespora cassiicola Philippines]
MIFQAYPEEQRDLRWVTLTLTSIATLLMICRMVATWKNRGWFGLEDGFVIAAATGGDVRTAIKYFWLTQLFYVLTNGFNKMAFLMLYHRVFPLPWFRKACKILMAISVAWTISFSFVVVFQCTPIERVYNRTIPGHCISFFWQRWTNAISNLATDLAIFLLPMPAISHLQMSLSARISLAVLFGMGFFICLVTALRMATLNLSLRAREPTWESAPANLWSFIEAAMGVICACLISLRRSVGRLWPKGWRGTKSGSGRSGRTGAGWYASGTGGRSRRGTVVEMKSMEGVGKGKTSVRVGAEGLGGRSESQERIIEGEITVTKDVQVWRA